MIDKTTTVVRISGSLGVDFLFLLCITLELIRAYTLVDAVNSVKEKNSCNANPDIMNTEDRESFNEEMSFMVEEMKRSFDTSVYRLSDMEKHALVDIVQQNPTIWDEQLQSYKNPQARAAAWRHVADEMQVEFGKNFGAEPLQKAFNNLRDVYVRKHREYSDVLRRKSGAESGIPEKTASWPFYKQMSFIDAGADQGERFCNVDFEDNEIIDVTEETQIVEVTETVGTTINNANAINTITSPFSQASPLLQTLALDHL
ncbi:unnamed protein product [Cylicocyclus nassatus]|uniref:MADF domain-containing protein n=1 Tax=Cylicocyclus nassatus TaxID=53992 RepID=A0AA36HBH5_CYLNA|nr:unnamed protein product [Cylicocyclus nassatus]